MQVKEIMTSDPACCRSSTSLKEVAQLMVENDCGCVPVVDAAGKPVGTITDRDICCRAVAQGKNPLELTAKDCMSTACVTIPLTATADECCELMEDHQIRRVLVTDEQGRCCGIVAQADIATDLQNLAGAFVTAVSQPKGAAARMH